MIFRLSQKVCTKIKISAPEAMPLDENPFADWTAHLFYVGQTQYFLLSNTKSLYSTLMTSKGIASVSQFTLKAILTIQDFMNRDGQAAVYDQYIAPSITTGKFSKALNRSVTSSMSQIVYYATAWLEKENMPVEEVGFKLNDFLLSSIAWSKAQTHRTPNEAFQELVGMTDGNKSR